MRQQREIPSEWSDRMIALGFKHNDRASARRLADAAGVQVGAVLRVIFRENFGDETVKLVGEAMRDEDFVAQWVGVDLGEPYSPPTVARNLTPQQRVLVDELIRELTKTEEGGTWDAGSTGSEESTPTRGDLALAARKPKQDTPTKHQPDPMTQAGEESQDNGTDAPA